MDLAGLVWSQAYLALGADKLQHGRTMACHNPLDSQLSAAFSWSTPSGYRYIRLAQHAVGDTRKLLVDHHMRAVNVLFYGACLGPAWFRIPEWAAVAVGQDPQKLPPSTMFLGMVPAILLSRLAISAWGMSWA